MLGFLDRAKGGTVLTGGGTNADKGFFVQPTVVCRRRPGRRDRQREVFGPVVSVQRFSSDEEALAGANGVRYGLAASCRCGRVTSAAQCAPPRAPVRDGVDSTDHIPLVSEMPHGGYKESGYGKDLSSYYSLEDYTQIKHVMVSLG